MFHPLRKLIRPKPKVKFLHPVFGELLLEQGAKGPYWLHEALSDGDLAISIDTTGDEAPTGSQVSFYRQIIGDQDAAYRLVQAALASEHEKLQGRSAAIVWKETFRLAGIGVPLNGAMSNRWDMTFECLTDNCGFLYTCYFESGVLARIGVDT